MKAQLRRRIPPHVYARAATGYHTVLDGVDAVLRRDRDLPPRRLRFIGSGDFRAIGHEFVGHATELTGLEPHHRVLDVGSGIGRFAIPLLDVLDERGSYEGFDIVPHGVRWCDEHVTTANPRFRFRLADVANPEYRPEGTPAEEFRFPYDDDDFDVAVLMSVFTHMLPAAVENYLSELRRVLKPGGRALITYYLLNDEARRLIDEGRAALGFAHEGGGYRTTNPDVPEEAIAYDEADVRGKHDRAGLPITGIHHGGWCRRSEYLSGQDITISTVPR